ALFSAARVSMNGSIDFDHASPTSTEKSATFRQFSLHWAMASEIASTPPVAFVMAKSPRFRPRHGDTSGRCPVAERFRVNRKRVLESHLARLVNEQAGLFHRVLGQLVQIAGADPDISTSRS